jgi:rhodanese-related sulfurtransferase
MVVLLELEVAVKELQFFLSKQESYTMKHKILYILLLLFTTQLSIAQKTLSEVLEKYNDETIPYIYSKELSNEKDITILDAREIKEYKTSHLKNAIYAGYNYFKIDSIQNKLPNKDAKIVVYCSIGIRSEDIGEKLNKAGYTNVYNLYGGIFEWKNKNFKVYNSEEKETKNVHVYSKNWSKWLTKGVKIFD